MPHLALKEAGYLVTFSASASAHLLLGLRPKEDVELEL